MVCEIKTKDEFEEIIEDSEGKLIVIQFTAVWCKPCKKILPKLKELSIKYGNTYCFKVDADKVEELTNKFNVKTLPTFLFYKNGKKLDECSGADTKKLEDMINKYN